MTAAFFGKFNFMFFRSESAAGFSQNPKESYDESGREGSGCGAGLRGNRFTPGQNSLDQGHPEAPGELKISNPGQR